jgi:hypothetical protein
MARRRHISMHACGVRDAVFNSGVQGLPAARVRACCMHTSSSRPSASISGYRFARQQLASSIDGSMGRARIVVVLVAS